MADPRSTPSDEGPTGDGETAPADAPEYDGDVPGATGELSEEELRRRVEEEYDFENFGPQDMAKMTAEEWEVAFEDDSWITGEELLDRVTDDLLNQVARREVFAVVEDVYENGERRVLAYSDEGYAVVYPDGSVAGFGTVLRDVKPVVALCSMDSYTPPDPPAEEELLPAPEEVPQGSGEFGNLMLQLVAGAQVLAGLGLFGAWLFFAVTGGELTIIAAAIGIIFVLVGVFLFATVANARLSDRFRAEEYRERLRNVGLDDGEIPEFVPVEDGRLVDPDQDRERASLEAVTDEKTDPQDGPHAG